MAITFVPTPFQLLNGYNCWLASAIPTLASDVVGIGIQAGDFVFITGSQSGPVLAKCVTAPGATYPGGQWIVCASCGDNVVVVNGAYTALPTDDLIIQKANAATTLPTAAAAGVGNIFTVTRNGAGNGTVVVSGNGLIGNGHHTVTFSADDSSITLVSDGTQYQIKAAAGTVAYS